MSKMILNVKRRWWVRPFFLAVYTAARVRGSDRFAERAGNWAARVIARHGLVFETR